MLGSSSASMFAFSNLSEHSSVFVGAKRSPQRWLMNNPGKERYERLRTNPEYCVRKRLARLQARLCEEHFF